MIILLTGEPHTGKTTVAEKFIEQFSGDCKWVLTREVIEHGQRAGYEAASSAGERRLLAHLTAVDSDVVIGHSQYRVDAGSIDRFFSWPLAAAVAAPPEVFVLDEIGAIQRQSPNFTPAVAAAFAQNLNLLATIRLRDKWTSRYRQHPYAACLAVTPATRDQLPDLLVTIFSNLALTGLLNPAQRQLLLSLTRRHAKTGNLLLLGKLYANALRYATGHALKPAGPDAYTATGDHGSYSVTLSPRPRCDCDLFNGRGQFAGLGGDCSHVMAARLMVAA